MSNKERLDHGKEKNRIKQIERDLGPLLLILLLCIFIPLGKKFHGMYLEKRMELTKKADEEKHLRQEIERLNGQLEEMKKEEEFLRTDDGVEKAARNKLGLIKTREIPFVVDPGKKEPVGANSMSFKNKKGNKTGKKKKSPY